MSKRIFYFCLFALLPVAFAIVHPIEMIDLGVWISLGREILHTHAIPHLDTFTLTASGEMVYPWLTCMFYAGLDALGGLGLVGLVHRLWPMLWIPLWNYPLREWSWPRVIANYLALLGCTMILVERPALIASVLFILAFRLISRMVHRGPFRRDDFLQLFILEVLWVNVHGTFIILPMLLGWMILTAVVRTPSQLRNRVAAFCVVCAATFVNPFGGKMLLYVWQTALAGRDRRLEEWSSIYNSSFPFATWYFILISIAIVGFLFWRRRGLNWKDFVASPFFPVWIVGFFAIRATAFTYLALPLFLGPVFSNTSESTDASVPSAPTRLSRIVNFAIILALVGYIIVRNPLLGSNPPLGTENAPVRIGEFLGTQKGTILNEWNYGSYLSYAQTNKYFWDTRNIIFPDQVFNDYDSFEIDPASRIGFIDKYKFHFVLMNSDRSKEIVDWLSHEPRFTEVMRDGSAVLFADSDARICKTRTCDLPAGK